MDPISRPRRRPTSIEHDGILKAAVSSLPHQTRQITNPQPAPAAREISFQLHDPASLAKITGETNNFKHFQSKSGIHRSARTNSTPGPASNGLSGTSSGCADPLEIA